LSYVLEESAEDTDPEFSCSLKEVIASKKGHGFINKSTTIDASAQFKDYVVKEIAGAAGGRIYF
jgi:hypothetical protein